MRKHVKWIIPAIAILALVCLAGYYLIPEAAQDGPVELDWSLKGACVDRDGNVQREMDFSVKGEVQPALTEETSRVKGSMYLTFSFPDDYRYALTDSYQGDESSRFVYLYDNMGYDKIDHPMVLLPAPFDLESSEYITESRFAMDLDKGYFIFYVAQEPNQFLVGSVDGRATPEQVLERFEAFINAACKA